MEKLYHCIDAAMQQANITLLAVIDMTDKNRNVKKMQSTVRNVLGWPTPASQLQIVISMF